MHSLCKKCSEESYGYMEDDEIEQRTLDWGRCYNCKEIVGLLYDFEDKEVLYE